MKMVAFRTFVRTPTAHPTDAASSSETHLIYQGKMCVRMKITPRPFEALLAHMSASKTRVADSEYEPDDTHKPVWYEGTSSDSTDSGIKRPRGRPPLGAVLENGVYILPPESVEAAAQRLELHRERCRARYRATRQALQKAKPELFIKHERGGTQQNLRRFECAKCDGLSEGVGAEGHQGAS